MADQELEEAQMRLRCYESKETLQAIQELVETAECAIDFVEGPEYDRLWHALLHVSEVFNVGRRKGSDFVDTSLPSPMRPSDYDA